MDTDRELRTQLRRISLRLNGDGTLTLEPGGEPIDPRGKSVEELATTVRYLLPSAIPALDDAVIEALVRGALARRGKKTHLMDAL
jgi:hypothetical protein